MTTIAAEPTGRGAAGARGRTRGRDRRLDPIREKVERGERLTLEDGDLLYTTPDIWSVCELAALVRNRLHGAPGPAGGGGGGVAFYNINRHLNYSNVCALSCKFCEFYRKKDEPGAYTRDMAYVREEVRKAVEAGATEIHSVGGLHPYLPWSYYPELVSTIRDEARRLGSDLHVKAFTAVEIVHLARIAKVYRGANDATEEGRAARREGIRWVLSELKAAGLGSLPGGGAEVFDDRVHDEAFKGKIRSDVWLDVHREAHALGLNTNATILYGHIEQRRERLVHMQMLRDVQDEAVGAARGSVAGVAAERRVDRGRFQAIIPLPFFPDGSDLEHLPGPTGLENLRTLAIARLMLDNFAHVKAFWIMQTLPMAQLMLQCGADDIDGTVVWYDITKVPQGSRDAATHQEVNVWTLQKAIRDAGFEPVERDTLYRRVIREGKDGRAWRAA